MGTEQVRCAAAAALVVVAGTVAHGGTGRIIVANDEWTLSNTGYSNAFLSTGNFVGNSVEWLTGSSTGQKVLAYSDNFGLTGSQMQATLGSEGHLYTHNASENLLNFGNYDAIMVGGNVYGALSAPNQLLAQTVLQNALISYVNGGGTVYLAGGTGDFGGAAGEAAAWNTFLGAFGMSFENTYNGIPPGGGVVSISSLHPIFAGVSGLYQDNGNSIINVTGPGAQLLVAQGQDGLYAIWDGEAVIPLPTASGMGLAGLLVLGMRRRR